MAAQHTPTLKHLYDSILRRYETAPAISFESETLTYGMLDERSSRLVNALVALGLRPADRVGLLLSNRPEYTVSDIALARAGLAKVPLNDMLSAADIEYMLHNSDASAVIVGPNFLETIQAVAPNVPTLNQIITLGVTDQSIPENDHTVVRFEHLLETTASTTPDVAVSADTLAGVFHTGGTTGDPERCETHAGEPRTERTGSRDRARYSTAGQTLIDDAAAPSAGLIMVGGLTQGSSTLSRKDSTPNEPSKSSNGKEYHGRSWSRR